VSVPVVLLELSIFPVDRGESLSADVAVALDIIDRSGIPYRLGPMGTTLEGEWDACMKVVDECFRALSARSARVLVNLKADYRQGRTDGLRAKTESVERQVGRKLCT
jgi:uncharacterized protein (TIGR00106 family)